MANKIAEKDEDGLVIARARRAHAINRAEDHTPILPLHLKQYTPGLVIALAGRETIAECRVI